MERTHTADGDNDRPRATLEDVDGELRLVVDGAVQSVLVTNTPPRGYWRALLPMRRPRSALILGLGGGTVAHLLLQRWRDIPITGVDDDPEVLTLARSRFGLDRTPLVIVEADARAYLRSCKLQFDLVVVDLYRGEVAAPYLSSSAFLRAVRQVVAPGGTAVWNVQRDQRGALIRRRSGRGLIPDRRVLAGLNLVVHYLRRRRVLHLSLPAC